MIKNKQIKDLIIGLVYHKRFSQVGILFAIFLCVLTVYSFGFGSSNFGQFGNFDQKIYKSKCADCLRVSILDIGQGDSIYIDAPNGNSLLVDAGPISGQVNKRITETGKSIFNTNIDTLLSTHPDADHIGGFQDVLEHFGTNLFIDPWVSVDTATYKNVINKINELKIQHIVARRGLNIVLDSKRNIVFHILYPDNNFYAYKYKECNKANEEHKRLHKKGSTKKCENVFKLDTNEMAIVGKLTYGKTSFMLTADAPQNVEDFLIQEFGSQGKCDELKYGDANSLCANVLKVGHHGSRFSTSPEFLTALSPAFAAISVGAQNKYGHPTDRVLQTLADASSSPEVLRTDKRGTITFISDGITVKVKN